MASFIGVTYFEVVKHAFFTCNYFIHCIILYISFRGFKLGLKGMDDADVPHLKKTFLSGLHFLIPIFFVLIFLLVYMRYTAGFSIFYATISLILVNLINRIIKHTDYKTGFD